MTEVVPPGRLRAAISLNAAVFQATRLVGPAIASLLIVQAGTGLGLRAQRRLLPRPHRSACCCCGRPTSSPPRPLPGRRAAVRTAAQVPARRPDVLWTIFLVGMVGTFGLNFPIVLTAMAKSAFGGNASTYGLFNIVLGARLGGRRGAGRGRHPAADPGHRGRGGPVRPPRRSAAALAPGMAAFLSLLAAMGFVNLVCQAMANSVVQLAVDPRAARPRDGPVHAGLHRRHALRRPGHRRDHQPLRRPGRHARLRRRAGLAPPAWWPRPWRRREGRRSPAAIRARGFLGQRGRGRPTNGRGTTGPPARNRCARSMTDGRGARLPLHELQAGLRRSVAQLAIPASAAGSPYRPPAAGAAVTAGRVPAGHPPHTPCEP